MSPTPTTEALFMPDPESPTLVVMAAGLSTRYGGLKQLDPIGPSGEAIMDYNVFDAARAGFARAVYVVRPEIEDEVREHVRRVVGDGFPTAFVHQTLDRVPEGFRPPPDRARPWGTGQAVLCASEQVSGAFGVCNADDLYGARSFEILRDQLLSARPGVHAALVGYTLLDTLSGSGGVARGICVLGRDGLLKHVTEVKDVRRVDGWISGRDQSGNPVELSGEEIVSMNLWGFTPHVLDLLSMQFARFLDRQGGDPDAEFLLSTALNGQVQGDQTQVAVLESPDDWFGVTHAGDRAAAEATLAHRIGAGRYPGDLAAAFRTLP